MALLSALVKAIADVEGIDEVQVGWVARHLREAGLISQAGRGRGAAHMTSTDAANLLIGVNAAYSAKEAVAAVQSFGNAKCFSSNVRGGENLTCIFSTGRKFGDALASLISVAQPSPNLPSELVWEIAQNTDYIGEKYILNLAENIGRLTPHIYDMVFSEIVFHRPSVLVSISIVDNKWIDTSGPSAPPPFNSVERSQRSIVDARFIGNTDPAIKLGDKKETSRISLKTIIEIARTLNS